LSPSILARQDVKDLLSHFGILSNPCLDEVQMVSLVNFLHHYMILVIDELIVTINILESDTKYN